MVITLNYDKKVNDERTKECLSCGQTSMNPNDIAAELVQLANRPQTTDDEELEVIRLTRPLLPRLSDFVPLLEEIWDEGWLTNRGKQHQLLERRLKCALHSDNLSLFCNGTMALMLGLKALRLAGEVITTPFTFPATVHAIDWAGLTPVFADIDPESLCIDPRSVEEAITERTSAILAVHVFGNPCDVSALEKIAQKHHLRLIYDAAHAFGVEICGIPVGNFGEMSMFSFHATKLFHTAEGGCLVYGKASLRKTIDLLHNFGIQAEDEVNISGINGKMNELQAALGLCVLDLVKEESNRRKIIANRYLANLRDVDGIRPVVPGKNILQSYQFMPILIGRSEFRSRDEIFSSLRRRKILARRYFRPLCSKIDCYSSLPSAQGRNLPHAERIESEILCLPIHGDLSLDDVDRVCEAVLG
jgi:dTDP-4-amino-4,6-dideoxygalactose transaminase